ncbi:hypothetical protein [Methanolapillus africanus]
MNLRHDFRNSGNRSSSSVCALRETERESMSSLKKIKQKKAAEAKK